MMNQSVEKIFRESSKALFAVGISVAGYALMTKAYENSTGDELKRVHLFERQGVKGVVVGVDTAYFQKLPVSNVQKFKP